VTQNFQVLGIDIAGIRLRLRLPRDLYPQAQRMFSGFVVDGGGRVVTVRRVNSHQNRQAGVATVSRSARGVTFTDGARYHARFDEDLRCGAITVISRDGFSTTPRPFALASALRSLVGWMLARQGGLLIHSAAVIINGFAVLCVGRSGAGKSTLAGFFTPEEALGDELIAMRMVGQRVTLHSTPFSGTLDRPLWRQSARWALGLHLCKDHTARIEPISREENLRRLMRCVAMPAGDAQAERMAFGTAARFAASPGWAQLRFPRQGGPTRRVLHRGVARSTGVHCPEDRIVS